MSFKTASIHEILEDLNNGRMIVLVDDEDRENEGDIVCAAEYVTPDMVNFMLKEARGVLCLSLTAETCDRLELSSQSSVNTTQRGTAFTVSIDAHEKYGVTTGVSSSDRAKTIRVAIDERTTPLDLAKPGHINPLRARDGGVLVRAGQTEGSVDLMRLAGLKQAAVIIEIMNDDGSMARRDDLDAFCQKHDLKMCTVADIIEYRLKREKLVKRIEEVPFHSEFGEFKLIAYQSHVDSLPHVALVKGRPGKLAVGTQAPVDIADPVLVRMHSQNLLGDVFADQQRPSGRMLECAMKMIQARGEGAVVYLRHEGMGSGLLKRLQSLQTHQLSGHTENEQDKPKINKGAYGIGAQILRDLGICKLDLITTNPRQPGGVEAFGLEINQFVAPEPS